MSPLLKSKLTLVTAVYWILLSYMVAALLWWFIALDKQNKMISNIRLSELKHDDPNYYRDAVAIENSANRKTIQFISEGTTFLVLILVGAVFVFRATRKQIKLSQQQQNFMMAVTHELKTPIAVAQLNLETLQKRQLTEDKRQMLIGNTLQEANRLNTLCNNILFAAQLDAGAYAATKQEVNFSDLLEGCVDSFKKRFSTRMIDEKITESIYMIGEPLLLQMLVNNLMDNANKYAGKGSPITISLHQLKDQIEFSVADLGEGIAEEEKNKIFQKFYRVGEENTRRTKGTGLGLYLCKKIVQGHAGRIFVSNNQPQGSIFTVIFKIAS
jgi:two-component system sensor histidine kinase CiaH